jgi:hypothetical protein
VVGPNVARYSEDVLGWTICKVLVENRIGKPFHLNLEIIDIDTCESLENAFIEMWSRCSHSFLTSDLKPIHLGQAVA